jgi:hypothetical protein
MLDEIVAILICSAVVKAAEGSHHAARLDVDLKQWGRALRPVLLVGRNLMEPARRLQQFSWPRSVGRSD